jgi:hypothetical protein
LLLLSAGMLSFVAGREITAFQVNACFIPGAHNYQVDYDKLLQLGELLEDE